MLVWDRNESLIDDGNKLEEGTSASVDSLRSQRRRSQQQRPNRKKRSSAVDAKLKKKLVSLAESETKTKTKTGFTKPKQAQMRKK